MECCIFCKIVKNEIPANIIYEDDKYLAFHDLNPKADFHVLIIPKTHIKSFNDVKENEKDLVKWMLDVAWKIIELKELVWCNLLMNSWPEHWQEVFHIHLHLMSNNLTE